MLNPTTRSDNLSPNNATVILTLIPLLLLLLLCLYLFEHGGLALSGGKIKRAD
jgi:hypothetical protein